MYSYKIRFIAVVFIVLVSGFPVSANQTNSQETSGSPSVGMVEFDTSCKTEIKETFNLAVAMLHHMMYAQTRELFEEMIETAPDCAMLQWGVAMTHLHPLWAPPSREELQKGMDAIRRAEEMRAPTQRERGYVSAIKVFYTDWEKLNHAERIAKWEKAQEELYLAYPDDIDAAAFYALAHLATGPKADKAFAHQKRAGKILEELHSSAPMHPAGYHYLIHAYDNPLLAAKALDVSRGYGVIAPNVPHALHMPTHIFVRLGLWDDVIQWNERSAAAALSQPVNGRTSLHFAHAIDYLVYGYLQKGNEQMAYEALERLNRIGNFQDSFASAYAIAAAQARYPLERSDWLQAASLPLRTHTAFPWDKYPWFESITYFSKGIGAARSGNVEEATKNLQALEERYNKTREAGQDYWAVLVDSQRASVAAWLSFARGEHDRALQLMRQAADLEDSVDKHPVTPGAVLPARELLGDMLLELEQYDEARLAYEDTLDISANRTRSLAGAQKATELYRMRGPAEAVASSPE